MGADMSAGVLHVLACVEHVLTCASTCGRVALLEKLALVPEASFDDADLHLLFQAHALLDPPGACSFNVSPKHTASRVACAECVHPAA